tara:strand:+ start:1569 stop:2957 length:1389 start_codon:yes stop_codon:yes gene_type:complete
MIPWGVETEAGKGADPVHVHTRLRALKDLFEDDPNQQLAFKTIVSEVQRCKLAWHDESKDVADDGTCVPDWWSTFVTDAIRSILINGNFIYRRCATRASLPVCIVADPVSVYTRWCEKSCTYVASCKRHRWQVGLVEPPGRGCGPHQRSLLINSAAVRAFTATRQLRGIIDNWVRRDNANSDNAIFTSVSDDLRNQNGSDRQWFREVTSSDHMPTRASDIDTNFATLVHRRAQTIEKLDAITHDARGRNASSSGARNPVGGTDITQKHQASAHTEHIVSDGRVYTEARQLGSMADSKLLIDELKHSILFSFGVPPQALGRNINSERIAASNRLTEMAITTYTSFINLLRVRIGEAMKSQTIDAGRYVGFSICLAQYELERLQPYLKDTICKKMIARCYEIPESFLDSKKIRATIEAEHGTGESATAAPGDTKPGAAAGSKRKAYTEEDTVKNLRTKASRPSK